MSAEQFSPEIEQVYEQLKKEAEEGGYHLNPDKQFTLRLIQGLLTNEKRFGYRACPAVSLGAKSPKTSTSSVPATIATPTLRSTVPATAAYMSARTGLKVKFPGNQSRNAGPQNL